MTEIASRHHRSPVQTIAPVTRASTLPGRPLSIESGELLPLVRTVTGEGGRMWVRIRGTSMRPAIPPGTLVRVGPLPRRGIGRGDIVLAVLADGRPVLHRVLSCDGAMVTLRGDALPRCDPPLAASAIVALADQYLHDGRVRPLPARPAGPFRGAVSRALRRVWLTLRARG